MSALLPPEFADLKPFVETWCLPTETERFERRLASSMDELQAASILVELLQQYPTNALALKTLE